MNRRSKKHNSKEWKLYKRLFIVVFAITSSLILANYLIKPEKNIILDQVEVNLIGNKNQILTINTEYSDPGFEVSINNNVVDESEISYHVTDNIDEKILGTYEVIYDITYDNKNYELRRSVEVVDNEAPVINLTDEKSEIFYCDRENKINIEYQAIDNYDGVITDKVKEERFDDFIRLSVKDSSNNETVVEVPLIITDEKSPFIELKGSKIQYVPIYGEYKEDGAVINDGCGKILNEEIKIINEVDVNIAGVYKVTYQFKIDEEKTITNERKVIVYEEYEDVKQEETEDKVVYLTFDDGPGKYTEELLNILKKYDVKATFFVTNQFKDYIHLLKREDEEGHVVAVHTLTHKWSIYQSVETYIKDFNDMNDIIYQYTGKRSNIFRFPGGSSNTISKSYSKGVVSAIRNRMIENGYVYFDWNVDSGDASGATKTQIYNNVIEGVKRKDNAVVLMHDIKKNTIDSIEDIIKYLIENGYRFDTLDENSVTVHHGIRN